MQRRALPDAAIPLLVLLLATTASLAGQRRALDTVASALQGPRGERVTVEAVVTMSAVVLAPETGYLTMQDSTGGVGFVHRTDSATLALRPGDRVRVTGQLWDYLGSEFIAAESFTLLGHGAPPWPVEVQAADLLGERYATRLVSVSGRLASRFDREDRVIVLQDPTGEVAITIPPQFFGDLNFVEQLNRLGEVTIVGIAGQIAEPDDPDSGYALYPRTPADIRFVPAPAWMRAVIIGAVILLLLSWLALVVFLARRRRERKEHLSALQHSERRFRSLFDEGLDPIFIMNGTRIAAVNEAAVDSLGYRAEDLVGLDYGDIEVGSGADVLQEAWRTVAAGGSAIVTGLHRRKDGSPVPVETRFSTFSHGGEQVVVAVARDVSEREELQKQLVQSMKMEAVGRLAGGVAHDFNNVLTTIIGHAHIILNDLPRDHFAWVEADEIRRSAERAATLTRQLLAFGRQQVLQPDIVDAGPVVAEMRPMLERLIDENIRLSLRISGDPCHVRVDRAQLQTAVVNLVVNARDAVDGHGSIDVTVRRVDVDEEQAGASGGDLAAGPHVEIRVTDTGDGIPPHLLEKIFEPFFTTKAVGHGTGLGLASIYGFVRQSGGGIQVTSEAGQGADFRILLPLVGAPLEDADQRPGATPRANLQPTGGCVLVVEDEDGVRQLVLRTLRRAGYHVLEAANGKLGLDVLMNAGCTVDLLVTDVVMPEMDGVELWSLARAARPDLSVLFISGYAPEEVLARGADGPILEKPFSPTELVAHVAEAMAGRSARAGTLR